jgi:hypothetical protein
MRHLLVLAGYELPTAGLLTEVRVTSALQGVIDALDPHPALVIGLRCDVLARNRTTNVKRKPSTSSLDGAAAHTKLT